MMLMKPNSSTGITEVIHDKDRMCVILSLNLVRLSGSQQKRMQKKINNHFLWEFKAVWHDEKNKEKYKHLHHEEGKDRNEIT